MGGLVRQWLRRSAIRVRENGWAGFQRSTYLLQRGLWRAGQLVPVGTNAFDREWDVLVVLDGCRVDLLREVAGRHDFVDEVDDAWSVGSTSAEWIRETFGGREEASEDVAYVTANPFVADYRELLADVSVDDVWQYGFDDDLGTIPPRIVTDRAITAHRERRPDRMVVHYMQPHHPFVGDVQSVSVDTSVDDIVGQRTDGDDGWEPGSVHDNNVWYEIKRGEVAADAVWESYRSNLELVLAEVELLLENVDGDVAISADHGNAMGELGMYGHPMGFLHPSVRKVPWVECEARDEGTHAPAEYDTGSTDDSRTEQLEALGYR